MVEVAFGLWSNKAITNEKKLARPIAKGKFHSFCCENDPLGDFGASQVRNQKANYQGEKRGNLHQSSDDQHRSLQFVGGLRLTCHGFHRGASDATNTDSGANGGQTGTDARSHDGIANVQ